MTAYRVVVTREDEAWLADVPDVAGAHTWARDLVALDKNVREVIALMLDLPAGAERGLDIEWEYHTGSASLDDMSSALRRRRRDAERLARDVAERTAVAVADLARAGFTVRDVAGLTGLSYQRVAQLLKKQDPQQPRTAAPAKAPAARAGKRPA